MKTLSSILIGCILLFVMASPWHLPADGMVDKKVESESVISYDFDFTQKDENYEETPLRRFEIVFFISLPVSLLITFLGIEGYRVFSGVTGPFASVEYQYMFLSTIGISLGVALKDQQAVFLQERF